MYDLVDIRDGKKKRASMFCPGTRLNEAMTKANRMVNLYWNM
jgi:hypothetical protein